MHITFPALSLALLLPTAATAACYDWPLRAPYAHDGDTALFTLPALPKELRTISVRLLNIDAPELKGRCEAETRLAARSRDALRALLAEADEVVVCPVGWDKYGGRVDAMIWADGLDVGEELVRRGLARAYDGGRRQGWCGDSGDPPAKQ